VTIEADVLISVLKSTVEGPVTHESIKRDVKAPLSLLLKVLGKLQDEGLIYLRNGLVEADTERRMTLAVRAVELGADLQRVSDFLKWQEFEGMAALALERNRYAAVKNVRFKYAGRKWEIDVVGCRKPLVVCIDCKHWRHGMHPSALKGMVEVQADRAQALSEALPSAAVGIECVRWERAKFVPVLLSLVSSGLKFHNKVPIVPVLQLQNFLSELPACVESVTYFARAFTHL